MWLRLVEAAFLLVLLVLVLLVLVLLVLVLRLSPRPPSTAAAITAMLLCPLLSARCDTKEMINPG